MVAQAEAVDRPLVVADADRAVDRHVLLVVAAREAAGVVLRSSGEPSSFTGSPPYIGDTPRCVEVDVRLDPRVLGERLARVRHLQRLGEHRDLAVVGGAQLLERRDHLEARAARVERVVVRDLRAGCT